MWYEQDAVEYRSHSRKCIKVTMEIVKRGYRSVAKVLVGRCLLAGQRNCLERESEENHAERPHVEDASAISKDNVLDRDIQNREIGETQIAKKDGMDTKLVGAYAAYARGLTPWYARGMLT